MRTRVVILHFNVSTEAEAAKISMPEIDGFTFFFYVTVNSLIEPFIKVVYDSEMMTEREGVHLAQVKDKVLNDWLVKNVSTVNPKCKNTININKILDKREDVSSFRTHEGEKVYITGYNSETHRMLKKSNNNG